MAPHPEFLSRAREQAVFGLLLALFLLLITRNVSSEPYVYDEADYMYAASLGFIANWSDTPSISMAEFVRAGFSGNARLALSERIRGGNDVLFYRHFHGPLFHYVLIPMSHLGLSEHAARSALLAIPCASLAVVYFGCLWLAPPSKAMTALVAAMLFLSSYSVIWSTELAPHQLFALCSLGSLILLLKAVGTGDRRYWCGSAVAAALAFCTLEVGFVLVLVVALCAWKERSKSLAASVVVFFATVLLVWPAAILRLSLVKSYVVMAYHALARTGSWGDVGFIDTWRARILDSPVESVLVGLALIFAFRSVRRYYPVALFAALMIAATLRVLTTTPRYSLAFMPVLDLLAGLALVPSLGPLRRPASFAVVTLAVAGLYGSAWYQVARQPHNRNPRSPAVLTYIHQNGLENKAVLAPQADIPALHYYFPGMRLRGYLAQSPTALDRVGFVPDAIIPAAKP